MTEKSQNKQELCCTYRSWLNYVKVFVGMTFFVLVYELMMSSKPQEDKKYWWIATVVILFSMYFILRIRNSKVILQEEFLITYSIFGKRKVYRIHDITKVTIANNYNEYIVIYFGLSSVLVRKDISQYSEFVKTICERLQIKDYSRSGFFTYDIRR